MKRTPKFTGAAFIVLLPLLALTGVGQAAQSSPTRLASACPRGETLIAPTGVTTDRLGVRRFSYRADPGLVAKVPPRGLTATRVTPALLADLGLSRRASSKKTLAEQAVELAKSQTAPEFCRSMPSSISAPRVTSGHGASALPFTHVYSSNWAGYAVTEAENGGPIEGAEGDWHVGSSHTTSTPSAESTWVGLGGGLGEGSSTWGLIQAGTEMQTNAGVRSFWEYIGSRGCVNTFCGQYSNVNSVSPGDYVLSEVYWVSGTQACFIFTDYFRTSGSFDVCQSNLPIPYDHTSAEWVNEWPEQSLWTHYDSPGTISWLGQNMTVSFNGGGVWISPFSKPFESVVMAHGPVPSGGTHCDVPNVLSYAENAQGTSSDTITCTVQGIDYP